MSGGATYTVTRMCPACGREHHIDCWDRPRRREDMPLVICRSCSSDGFRITRQGDLVRTKIELVMTKGQIEKKFGVHNDDDP